MSVPLRCQYKSACPIKLDQNSIVAGRHEQRKNIQTSDLFYFDDIVITPDSTDTSLLTRYGPFYFYRLVSHTVVPDPCAFTIVNDLPEIFKRPRKAWPGSRRNGPGAHSILSRTIERGSF